MELQKETNSVQGKGEENKSTQENEVVVMIENVQKNQETEEPEKSKQESYFRVDIEGLRGIAVLLVLLYHAGIMPFYGGYLGVDVFYTISGYVVTRKLMRDISTKSSIDLLGFYANRFRRLIPASVAVVFVTWIAAKYILDIFSLGRLASDIRNNCMFWINMHFAGTEISYFSPEQDPSPLLHFWSLAVEEQFYFIWPILFVLLNYCSTVFRRVIYILLIVGFLILSFLWANSNAMTRYAFYSLPSRAWEMLLGAFVAEIEDDLKFGNLTKNVNVLGLAGIIVTSIIGKVSEFVLPGYLTMIPCIGTGLILLICDASSYVSIMLSTSVLRWIGKASYSIYLWHWPPIILVSIYMYGSPFKPTIASCLLGYAISVPFVLLSVYVIENGLRTSKYFQSTFRGLLIGAALLVSPLLLVDVVLPAKIGSTSYFSPNLPKHQSDYFNVTSYNITLENNTNSLMHLNLLYANVTLTSLHEIIKIQLSNRRVAPDNLTPPLDLHNDGYKTEFNFEQTYITLGGQSWPVIRFGNLSSNRVVMFVGDSHATNAVETWYKVLEDTNFVGYLFQLNSCTPFSMVVYPGHESQCQLYQKLVVDEILRIKPHLVVVRYLWAADELNAPFPVDGFSKTELQMREWFSKMISYNVSLLLMSDNPRANSKHYLYTSRGCIAANVHDYSSCMFTQDHARYQLWNEMNRKVAQDFNVPYLETLDFYCYEGICPPILGNIMPVHDNHHVSQQYGAFMAPYLQAKLIMTNFTNIKNPFLKFKDY